MAISSSRPKNRNGPLNASGIKKRNGPLKGNVIGRVLHESARLRRECGTGRLSVLVPCKTKRGHRKSTTDKAIQMYVNVASYLLILSLVYNMTLVAEHYGSITNTHRNNVHEKKMNETSK